MSIPRFYTTVRIASPTCGLRGNARYGSSKNQGCCRPSAVAIGGSLHGRLSHEAFGGYHALPSEPGEMQPR